ncbi:Cupin domain protein [compost metagenome]
MSSHLHHLNQQPINLLHKASQVTELWSPKVVAEMNDYQFKVVRIQGDFVWHSHSDTDEAFFVLEGQLRIDFRDRYVTLGSGDLFIVPKGVEHKPYAEKEVMLMLIEPQGVVNTGDEVGDRTAESNVWI